MDLWLVQLNTYPVWNTVMGAVVRADSAQAAWDLLANTRAAEVDSPGQYTITKIETDGPVEIILTSAKEG